MSHTKKLTVTKVSQWGEPWEMEVRGVKKKYQTFFINAKELDYSLKINREVTSAVLQDGPQWFEVEDEPAPGKNWHKAKVTKDPGGGYGSPQPAQTALPLETPPGPMRWGEAVLAAATLLTTDHYKELLKDGVPGVADVAKNLYLLPVPSVEVHAAAVQAEMDNFDTPDTPDTVPTELPESIKLDDLPF